MPMIDTDRFFTLMGHGKVFRAVHFYDAAGFIPSVYGVSLDGKWRTSARIVDVRFVRVN